MLNFKTVEEVCESKDITLVVHPAIRRAIRGHEEIFYGGLHRFLQGETDGIFSLPLLGSNACLVFSQRYSSGGYSILRVDPFDMDDLQKIKAMASVPQNLS